LCYRGFKERICCFKIAFLIHVTLLLILGLLLAIKGHKKSAEQKLHANFNFYQYQYCVKQVNCDCVD